MTETSSLSEAIQAGNISEMVERASRAICTAHGENPDALRSGSYQGQVSRGTDGSPGGTIQVQFSEPMWLRYVPDVRTTLKAIREPTDALVKAGDGAVELDSDDSSGKFFYRYHDGDAADVWDNMIAEALGCFDAEGENNR